MVAAQPAVEAAWVNSTRSSLQDAATSRRIAASYCSDPRYYLLFCKTSTRPWRRCPLPCLQSGRQFQRLRRLLNLFQHKMHYFSSPTYRNCLPFIPLTATCCDIVTTSVWTSQISILLGHNHQRANELTTQSDSAGKIHGKCITRTISMPAFAKPTSANRSCCRGYTPNTTPFQTKLDRPDARRSHKTSIPFWYWIAQKGWQWSNMFYQSVWKARHRARLCILNAQRYGTHSDPTHAPVVYRLHSCCVGIADPSHLDRGRPVAH